MAQSPVSHRGGGSTGRYVRKQSPSQSSSQAIIVLSLCTILFIFTFFTVITLHSATLLQQGQEDVYSIQKNAFIVNNRLKETMKNVEDKMIDTIKNVEDRVKVYEVSLQSINY